MRSCATDVGGGGGNETSLFKCICYISLVKRQFFVTYTFRPTVIPASLDSSGQKRLLSKCCVHKKKIISPYIFVKSNMLNCLSVEDRSSFFLL